MHFWKPYVCSNQLDVVEYVVFNVDVRDCFALRDLSQREHVGESVSSAEGCAR